MTRSLKESSEKVTQLLESVAFFKSIIPDTRKAIASAEKSIDLLENKCRHLEDIISAKDRKIIALVDQILSKTEYSDVTIELEIYSSTIRLSSSAVHDPLNKQTCERFFHIIFGQSK